jgi:hypothetical protein
MPVNGAFRHKPNCLDRSRPSLTRTSPCKPRIKARPTLGVRARTADYCEWYLQGQTRLQPSRAFSSPHRVVARQCGQTAVDMMGSHRADGQPLFGRSIKSVKSVWHTVVAHTQRCGVSEEPYHSAVTEPRKSASAAYLVPKITD